jgi:hypothetical protein
MSQKKKKKNAKTELKDVTKETPQTSYRSDFLVWIVWKSPKYVSAQSNSIPRQDLHGVFSTEGNAELAVSQEIDQTLMDFEIKSYVLDYKLTQLRVKYWRPA